MYFRDGRELLHDLVFVYSIVRVTPDMLSNRYTLYELFITLLTYELRV